MVLESGAATPREREKKVLRVSTHTPSSPAFHSPPPNIPPPPSVITISARSPPTMTHVCAHTQMHKQIVLTHYWSAIRSVLGGVLHTFNQSFSLLLVLSLSLSLGLQCQQWSLSCSTVILRPHLVHSLTGYTAFQ